MAARSSANTARPAPLKFTGNLRPVSASTGKNILSLFDLVNRRNAAFPKVNRRKTAKPVVHCEKCKATFFWQAKCRG